MKHSSNILNYARTKKILYYVIHINTSGWKTILTIILNKNDNILISQLISQLFIIHARVSKHQEIFILFIDVISNSRQFYHTIWLVTKNGYAEITHEFKYTCTT